MVINKAFLNVQYDWMEIGLLKKKKSLVGDNIDEYLGVYRHQEY